MVKKKIEHPYYSFDKINSYNGVWNFCVGGRGIGKTWGRKHAVIRKFIRKGEQFIYLRRFQTDLSAKDTFFADIDEEFPEHDFRVFGREAQIAPITTREDKKRVWQTMGYFVCLTAAQSKKGVSYHRVTEIIFDEFIIEKGFNQYLPAEATTFLNFYVTVDRFKDKTKVFFLANSVSITNPYFRKYNIKPDQDGEFVVKEDGFIVAHFVDSEDFGKSVYETRFGRFIADSDYAEYAVSNTFADNHTNLITAKHPRARYAFTLETKEGTFSLWHDMFESRWYAQAARPGNEDIRTLLPNNVSEDKPLMTIRDKPLQSLRTAFRHGRLLFDTQQTRNLFIEVF